MPPIVVEKLRLVNTEDVSRVAQRVLRRERAALSVEEPKDQPVGRRVSQRHAALA